MSYYSLTTNLHCRARFSYNCNKVSALSVYLKLKEKVKIMGNKKFNLTKLALAMGVTLGLSGCFSDNDNNVEIKPPVVEPPVTEEVVQPPAAVEKKSGSFAITVVDSKGEPLPADTSVTITFTNTTDGLLKADGSALDADDAYFTTTSGNFAFTVDGLTDEEKVYEFTVSSAAYIANNSEVALADGDALTEAVRLTPREFESEDIPVVSKVKTLDAFAGDDENAGVESVEYNADAGLVITGDNAQTDEDGKKVVVLTSAIPETQKEKAKGQAKVKMKEGIKFVDENDQPLTAAPTLTVAYFANEASAVSGTTAEETAAAEEAAAADDTSSLEAFPGGLNLDVDNGDGSTAGGNFTSGGFVAIELRNEDGQVVKSFGTDENGNPNTLEVAMTVDKNTKTPCPIKVGEGESVEDAAKRGFTQKNAENKGGGICLSPVAQPVALEAGHVFPVWSYEESTGQWSFEQFGEVTESSTGDADTFDVVVKVDHLSYWNLDFFAQQGCPRVDFNIVEADGTPSKRAANIQLIGNSYRFERRSYNRARLDKVTFLRAPSFDVSLRIMENGKNILDGLDEAGQFDESPSVITGGICDLNGKTVKLIPEETVEKSTVTATPVARCSNNDAEGVVAAPDVASAVTVKLYRGATLSVSNLRQTFYQDSAFAVELDQGQEYTFSYTNPFTNALETRAITPDAATGEITLDMPLECEVETVEVTGTGSGS